MWTVNPPGYGGSSGAASLQALAACAEAVYEHLQTVAAGRAVVLSGASLGCVSALYLAARRPISGVVLRNPPALREVIHGRFGWWNLQLITRPIARQVPHDLCAIENARRSRAPAVFLLAMQDRIVPPRYQQAIHEAYGGESTIVQLHEADHATPLTDEQQCRFRNALLWLEQKLPSADAP
jgi:pimeloyl-ACP methyl ester carboxylesterase